MKTYTSVIVIIVAALLLELTTGIMYIAAQKFIQRTMEHTVKREMDATYMNIRNKLANVEVTIDNMAWVVNRDLESSDWMFETPEMLAQYNSFILGFGISFAPYYYPQKGRWFEPYAVRRANGTIETMQLGSAQHDYFKADFYNLAKNTGKGNWCEPYMDNEGAKAEVTTYSVPVYSSDNKFVAVVHADISLGWLNELMNDEKIYQSTQRYLVTSKYTWLAGQDTPVMREVLKVLKADDDYTAYFTMEDQNGNKLHVFYTPVGGKTDWVLINVLEDNDIFGRLRSERMALALPVMIGFIFIGFIVWRSAHNIERLRKINADKERIDSELQVANKIQQSMLPHEIIRSEEVHIYGSLVPAREVGGDLYDYFIRDGKLFFCIGDVSGKGAPSAMLMAVTHALFRAAAAHESNPAHIMQNINEVSCQGNDSNMFVTMFIGVLDLPTGHLRYSVAGHDAPFILTDGKWTKVDVTPCLPVGVFDDMKYTVQETKLQPDSTIFLYTDGLTEAMNNGHEMFKLERVKTVLNTMTDKAPQTLLEKMTDAVNAFVEDAEQSDDLTMLTIHYTPKKFESTMTETLILKNNIQEVTRFSSFMKAITDKLGIEKSLARQLRLAVEEAVVNVINYAYPMNTKGDVIVKVMVSDHVLHFQIIDSGMPFDPTKKERTDTTVAVEDRQIGGLGILLVRELMDSINYERIDGKNILTLIKNI